MSCTFNDKKGLIAGMIISALLIVSLVVVLCCVNITKNQDIVPTVAENLGFEAVENYESYQPGKFATVVIHRVNGEDQGVVSTERVDGGFMINARPIVNYSGASFVFGYWQKNGVKIAGDKTIRVRDDTSKYSPVFIKEYDAQHKNTGLVHYITSLSQITNYASGHIYLLQNDIKLNTNHTPIPNAFAGILDGCGHKIENLKVNFSASSVGGLFNNLNGGVIKNLTIRSGKIESASATFLGAFAGTMQNALISRCVNYAIVKNTYASGYSASIVGGCNGNAGTSALFFNSNYGAILSTYAGPIVAKNVTASRPIAYMIHNFSK